MRNAAARRSNGAFSALAGLPGSIIVGHQLTVGDGLPESGSRISVKASLRGDQRKLDIILVWLEAFLRGGGVLVNVSFAEWSSSPEISPPSRQERSSGTILLSSALLSPNSLSLPYCMFYGDCFSGVVGL